MRNLFLFIRRYFTFISFLMFQVLALSFLFKYNRYHRVAFLGVANEVTGRVNKQVDMVDDYFHLRQENERVHRMNDSLLNLLSSNFVEHDTSRVLVKDTVSYDTTGKFRQYYWRQAKVVANSVISDKNYIQLDRGANQGIKDNWAVVSSDGVPVGVVANVSPNFCQVMSLLHVQRTTPVMMKRSRTSGILSWDGKDPRFLTLRRIPASDSVGLGDTVVTSVYDRLIFPPDLLVGTVAKVDKEKASGDYILTIRPAVNFQNIQQAFIVENLYYDEQVNLTRETRKKVEDPDKKTK